MKRSKKLMGLTAVIMGVVMATAACGSSGGAAETKAADSAASTEAATEAAGGDTSAAGDLNSKTVDELTEAAKSYLFVCLMNGQTGHPCGRQCLIHTAFPTTIQI